MGDYLNFDTSSFIKYLKWRDEKKEENKRFLSEKDLRSAISNSKPWREHENEIFTFKTLTYDDLYSVISDNSSVSSLYSNTSSRYFSYYNDVLWSDF